jgi:arsenite oxidase small subunit
LSQDEGGGKQENSDERTHRRNFIKWALGTSLILVIAGVAAVTKSLWTPGASSGGTSTKPLFPKVRVASLSNLQPNTPVVFNYPLDDEPSVIVKIGQRASGGVGPDGDIVAFSIVCQHLGCVVGYQALGASPNCNPSFKASGPVGYCCCHSSVYDFANSAKVVGGPSPRPLPQIMLEVDEATGDIFAVGMGPPAIFGHNTGSSDVSYDLQGGNLVS